MEKKYNFTLEDHLDDCEKRYEILSNHMDRVDRKLNRIDDLLVELKILVKNQ